MINLGSIAPGVGGLLDNIQAPLFIHGDPNFDTLNLDIDSLKHARYRNQPKSSAQIE